MRPTFATLLAFALGAGHGTAQQFSGTFSVTLDDGGRMVVVVREARDGSVSGQVTSPRLDMQLEGRIEAGTAVGALRGAGGGLYFEAERWENELWLTLYGVGPAGEPNYDDFQEIDLYLEGTEPVAAPEPGAGPLGGAQGGGNPLGGGGADPFVGTFTDGNVTLLLQGVGGQYQGQVTVGGQTYPVSATGGVSGLQGVINAPDGNYAIAMQSIDGGLYVVSGGQQYHLVPHSAYMQGRYGQPGALAPGGQYGPGGVPGATAGSPPPAGRPGAARPPPAPPAGARAPGGRPLAPGFTLDHPRAVEWTRFLAGKKLTRMSSYSSGSAGGYSGRADVYLCSDQSFSLRDESSVNVDVGGVGGSAGGVDTARGHWYVITDGQVVGLVLELDRGGVIEFRVDYQNGATFVDGQRVYVTPAELCG